MNKIEYLKLALGSYLYKNKKWIFSAFSVMNDTESKDKLPIYSIVRNSIGVFYLDEKKELIKITDAKTNDPLFSFQDKLIIDNTWCPNLDTKLETTIGVLLLNLIVLVESFGTKLKYINSSFKVKQIENIIAKSLIDNPEDNNYIETDKIYVKEHIAFVDALNNFIADLSPLCVISSTKHSMLVDPGLKVKKEEILKRYEGQLNDYSKIADYEKEIKAIDDEYMKTDSTYGKFYSGKIKDISRLKLKLSIGAGQSFDNNAEAVFIENSLSDGWPKDKKQITAAFNDSRFGSYSRGAETVNGGVTAKTFNRAISNFTITDNDCNTKFGKDILITDNNYKDLITWRYLVNKDSLLTEDQAKLLINKNVKVRSIQYCNEDGDKICKICAGHRLAQNKNSLAIGSSEFSSIILATSMKAMHGKVLSTKRYNFNDLT